MMRSVDARAFARRFGWPVADIEFPLAIAHRGASGHAIENTLAAFAKAADLGADMWELDTQLTRDGVCVVSHDDNLLPVFGLDLRISALTAVELAGLEGASVPTFASVAALARERGAGLYVELKAPSTGALVLQELARNGQRFAALGSFDLAQLRPLREAGCDYPLAVLVRVGDDPHALASAAEADIVHLCWERAGPRPQDLVTTALIDQATRDGRQIVLWHEERADIIADIVTLPVLGICSDRPDLLRAAAGVRTRAPAKSDQ
jgi:glycerophosphoryl diester phosphodiesterase